MIYLDNSATTMVDDRVLDTFNKVCARIIHKVLRKLKDKK